MKLALFALLFSFSSLASTCFTRPVDLETNEISLAREICVDSIKLDLDYFGSSKATVKMNLDGKIVERNFSLNNGQLRADGSRLYVVELESRDTGFSCSEMWEVKALASVVLNSDASKAVVENVKGELYYSWDHCHSNMDLKQSFFYNKN